MCISNCTIKNRFKNICKINNKDNEEEKNEGLSSKIIQEILNGNLGELLEEIIKNESDIIIAEEFATHQLSSLNNQINNKNMSSIIFGKCEDELRYKYNISDKEEIIIYKIENKVEGFLIPIIEYALFNQNGNIILNLNFCENISIEYNIPVKINENEKFKYDPSSDFYNDKCNKYTKDGNMDMTLYDIKK